MKKTIIAVLIGGIIMFAYQTASWMSNTIHKNAMKHTDSQDSILQCMAGLEDGLYMLPMAPPGTPMKEAREQMTGRLGTPWAMVFYHNEMTENMATRMPLGLLYDLISVWFFVWILRKNSNLSRGSAIITGLAIALITIFTTFMMNMNWFSFPMHYVSGEIIDTLLMWFFTSIWLGWYLTRKSGVKA